MLVGLVGWYVYRLYLLGCVYCSQCITDTAATVNIVISFMKKSVGCFLPLPKKDMFCHLFSSCSRRKCSFHLLFVASFKKCDELCFPNKSSIKPRNFFNDDIKQVTVSSCRRSKVRRESFAHTDWLNSFCQSQLDDTLTLLWGLLQ